MSLLKFKHSAELDSFFQTALEMLEKGPGFQWKYSSTEDWNAEKIKAENVHILNACTQKAGIYAIFCDDDLIYVGQTQAKTARERIKNHFIKKDPRTGSKLEKVQSLVADKKTVGFTFIEVSPASLRHFLEEKLIERHKPDWNIQGKKP